ncbi:MAG: LysM peptidoglycan-binding domain-containing protein [Clostridia bacterium]|nr:LysM peptidoglycan-binding domain-containing protein [Clostridia bacterium]
MIIYVVKSGDTLSGIASLYGVGTEELTAANGMPDPNALAVGQTVVVPGNGDKLGTLAVNGYAYPFISPEALDGSLPYLTSLTVFTYGFTRSGELISPDDEGLTGRIREGGVGPVMLISTLTEEGVFSNELSSYLFGERGLWDTLVDNILSEMREKGYAGLDIDFEYVFADEAGVYAEFVTYVRERLNAEGYYVIVALAPKTSADQPGLLYQGHDYRLLGEAADRVLLMTYEWGYTYGPPMAVAPINKVEEVVSYAVTEIPPEKIYMGVPNYGYDWTLPFVRGESRARSISNNEAVSLASSYRAEIKFDETAKSPYFNYTDGEGGTHEVWFEDARSIQSKLALANRYGLYGVGYWNLMRYFRQNWTVLSEEYNIRKNA